MKCSLCPRRCGSERTETQNIGGFCGQPLLPKVARAALHFWEEPCISGKNGSGTVFFSGCVLGCVYCQNYEISHGGKGKAVTVQRLAEIFRQLEQAGAHNINLVSPSHFALAVKAALDIYKPSVPIVWNSGGYDSVATLKMLEGYIDIFLMDMKYISGESAALYSAAPDYPKVAADSILEAYRQSPECVFSDGLMKKGVIVRHLVLPQATREAMSVFDFVRNNTPRAYFSLMSQYIPCGDAQKYKKINRRITRREYEKVVAYICESGFENCYIQEPSSADKEYIPEFDFRGV